MMRYYSFFCSHQSEAISFYKEQLQNNKKFQFVIKVSSLVLFFIVQVCDHLQPTAREVVVICCRENALESEKTCIKRMLQLLVEQVFGANKQAGKLLHFIRCLKSKPSYVFTENRPADSSAKIRNS